MTLPDGLEPIVREVIVRAPLARLLGMELVDATVDHVRIRLPFRSEVTTVGELVHGGSIGALVDVTATAAAWTGADLARRPRGTTIGLTVNFLNGAQGAALVATGAVVQRGQSIVVCDVAVDTEAGLAVARALVTYKLTHRDR